MVGSGGVEKRITGGPPWGRRRNVRFISIALSPVMVLSGSFSGHIGEWPPPLYAHYNLLLPTVPHDIPPARSLRFSIGICNSVNIVGLRGRNYTDCATPHEILLFNHKVFIIEIPQLKIIAGKIAEMSRYESKVSHNRRTEPQRVSQICRECGCHGCGSLRLKPDRFCS